MGLEEILKPVAAELRAVESQLRAWSEDRLPIVAQTVEHVVCAGGKRLRPAALLFAAGLRGTPSGGAVELAAGVEIIHTASLVHDDMIDQAAMRRGAPTVHARWGPQVAVLLGDLLYSRLLNKLSENGHGDAFREVSHTIHRMVVGQLAETMRRDDVTTSEAEYYEMVRDKTGSLFSCSTFLGARAGGLSPDECERLRRFGRRFGRTYQIVDDILDICEDAGGLGKPTGADLRDGKVTLPVIHALREDAGGGVAEFFAARDAAGLCAAVRRLGSLGYALERAGEAAREAEECLAGFPDGPYRRGLLGLVDYALACGRKAVDGGGAGSGKPSPAAARPGPD
ncbi:MAG: polyprenyl synthetase family protein [Planctomycetota bacterium]